MNKARIDRNIKAAYMSLAEVKIAVDGKVKKAYRGQISSFGAALSTGSLLSAVAFFSDNGSAQVDRTKLMDAIMVLVKKNNNLKEDTTLFKYVCQHYNDENDENEKARIKEEILDYAIAIKLAMNLYQLT